MPLSSLTEQSQFRLFGERWYTITMSSSTTPSHRQVRRFFTKRNISIAVVVAAILFVLFHVWLSITNPYADISVVEQPYTTTLQNGTIKLEQQFSPYVDGSDFGSTLGYYKSGFLIIQNAYFGSHKTASRDHEGIVRDIHQVRFDPSKPYLITGDQFSVLYPRNLGVFYNSILNPNTAHSQTDWQNRQRIYLQSAAFAVDAFSRADDLATTLVPIGSRSFLLTQVHPGSVPSDTLYGIFYALAELQNEKKNSNGAYNLQTAATTKNFVQEQRDDMNRLLAIYQEQVQDPTTGMIREGLDLASARDGVVRDRSFYDNVVLWKTMSLARELGVRDIPQKELDGLRTKIISTFWNDKEGFFRDDMKPDSAYSSDWLLALPTGLLNPNNAEDRKKLIRSVDYTRAQGIDKPFPIKYQASTEEVDAPWAVKTFVPNYGGDAIWSYWGAQYITLLAQLADTNPNYLADAIEYRDIYHEKMEETRGFPETFDAEGEFLQNPVYKSIRQTGWVVQLEEAEWAIEQAERSAH